MFLGHESQEGEDDGACVHGGTGVDGADHEGVPVDVVVVLVVRSKSYHGTKTQTIGEKDLGGGIDPDPGVSELVKVGIEEVGEAIGGTIESDASEEEDGEEDVGEDGSEVDHLARPADALPDAEVAENPGDAEGDDQLDPQTARFINSRRLLQSLVLPELGHWIRKYLPSSTKIFAILPGSVTFFTNSFIITPALFSQEQNIACVSVSPF